MRPHVQEPIRSERPAAVPQQAPTIAHPILQLQALAGNAAVSRLVTVQRQGSAEEEYLAAVERSDWRTALAYLATRPADELRTLAESLVLGQVEAILSAVGTDQHMIRGTLLERGFALTKGSNWEKAARFISTLDDAGIARNLAPLSSKELKLLAKGARTTQGGGDERLLRPIRTILRVRPEELFGKTSMDVKLTSGSGGRKVGFCLANITFEPDPDIVAATKIGFIQTISMVRTAHREESIDTRDGIEGRLNDKAQAVDRDPGQKHGFYGQPNAGPSKQTMVSGVTPGSVINGEATAASMTDRPDVATADATYSFETAVVAQEGDDVGWVYAVVTWSFSSDSELNLAAGGRQVQDRPTAGFGTAVAAWNRQAALEPATPGQVPLPELKPVQRTVVAPVQPPPVVGQPVVQRDPQSEEPLKAIQGNAMFALLPDLAALPGAVRADRVAGQLVGGARLTAAMSVVAAKGRPWLDVVGEIASEMSSLPVDQVGDIMRFLGAPTAAALYPRGQFGGRFDGVVDPSGRIRLVMRVKFAFGDGLRFGEAPAGTPQWEKETIEGKAQFGPDFKRVVEAAWSGKGRLRPACPIGAVREFVTEVQVVVVDADEHIRFDVVPGSGRSHVGQDHTGALSPKANLPSIEKRKVSDERGRNPVDVENTQIPSAHEFGHAMGVKHVRPGAANDDNAYGVTPSERRDVMGAGDRVQILVRGGKVVHDDLEPFETIAKRWGRDVFKGALEASCNRWSGSAE